MKADFPENGQLERGLLRRSVVSASQSGGQGMTRKCVGVEKINAEIGSWRQAAEKLRANIRDLGGVPAFEGGEWRKSAGDLTVELRGEVAERDLNKIGRGL